METPGSNQHGSSDPMEIQVQKSIEAVNDGNGMLEPSDSLNSSFSSSPYFSSTRRSSIAAASIDDGSTQLSSRTSFSSLRRTQTLEEKASIDSDDDTRLEEVCANEHKPNKVSGRPDPFADYTCAFGFTGKLEEPSVIPDTKSSFLQAVQLECRAVTFIQQGLKSYAAAINSGEYHTFTQDFLDHQNTATETTIKQLDSIRDHLIEVIEEVQDSDLADEEVKAELKAAYSHARPWIQRTRAILVSSHVFYKINYVLGSDKKVANCGSNVSNVKTA